LTHFGVFTATSLKTSGKTWIMNHEDGALWTLESLKVKAGYNKTNKIDGKAKCGVREDLYSNFLLKNIIWPLLHGQIGIGNNMLTHLVEIGDCEIQCLPRAEFKIIQETRQLEFDITNARQEKADWEQRNKSELKKLERKQAQLSEWIESNKQASQPAVAVVSQQLKEVSDHLAPLQKELATISKEISALASKFKSNTEKLKGFKKARKSQEDSVCTKIDKILKKYDINRAAYHGGDC
jgi:hypothetical protein